MKDLKPGEARPLRLRAFACRCTRCGHEWIALPRPLEPRVDGELAAEIPDRCATCRSPYWREPRGSRPRGRPPKEAPAAPAPRAKRRKPTTE